MRFRRQRKDDFIQSLIERVCRRSDNRERLAFVEPFVSRYCDELTYEDLTTLSEDDLCGAVQSLLAMAQRRMPGKAEVRISNPTSEGEGWSSRHTVLEIVNDDMPFLVDSLAGELNRRELSIHQFVHPQFTVHRDSEGQLLALHARSVEGSGFSHESFMHIEIDLLTDPAALLELETTVQTILADVRSAVEDWRSMRDTLTTVLEELAAAPPPLPPESLAESRKFLEWAEADNFTFLGCRFDRLEELDGERFLRPAEAGFGLMSRFSLETRVHASHPLTPSAQHFLDSEELVVISKSRRRARVHRLVHMDVIAVKRFTAEGELFGVQRFVGLFTSRAYAIPAGQIPLVRRKVARVLERSGYLPASHNAKALRHILEHFPRDELFQISEEDLHHFAMRILELQLRPQMTLLVRRDEEERFVSCMVYVPRERFSTELRQEIQELLEEAFHGEVTAFTTRVSELPLAQLQLTIRTPGPSSEVDLEEVEARLVEVIRSWRERLREALAAEVGEEAGLALFKRYGKAFPSAYREASTVNAAVEDIRHIDEVLQTGRFALRLYCLEGAASHRFHLRTFEHAVAVPLTGYLPMLENMGLEVIGQVPFEIRSQEAANPVWVRDFELATDGGFGLDLERLHNEFAATFRNLWEGRVESDSFNELVLRVGLSWRQVMLLRAYCKYLRQTRIPFSQSYMAQTLGRNPEITHKLVALFEQLLDPRAKADGGVSAAKLAEGIRGLLEDVTVLDEDRILRRYLVLIEATLRTNYFQTLDDGEPKPYLSLKLDTKKIPDLPPPRPEIEVFVYSPRTEAVHLRGGKVARGGIRWSDRREDFRTEILGLVKAQMVKNAVIVPVGAKGGFVVKNPPADRVELLAEGKECYRTLIRGLLDVTDNLVDGEVVPPRDVVRRDGDDTYLVVAADKGTASFSDIANEVAEEYGFWLGDAFASGGSAGYDHKGMGITARGAWESVKRHFREMGRDIGRQPFTVVGVGDMSGDVFGNGMLLSEHTQLLAAFNHMHIFVDPDPDPAASWAARRKLFDTPGSTWADYPKAAFSTGGDVFKRDAKSITVSPRVRERFALPELTLTPNELIRALLLADVDLLWFGGIGTYVKANAEHHNAADDRGNDDLRVNASELRAKVVGEGANLAVTQAGRVELSLRGGRINTDFIDNSGGVGTSDMEVNIKIALADAVRAGSLDPCQRDDLLAEMTEEVSSLVLRHNYLQAQALSLMESHRSTWLHEEVLLMRRLEKEGRLDRKLEGLPDDATLLDRRGARSLSRPEGAVLLAYGKIFVYEELIASDLPDDPRLVEDLRRYFPAPVRKGFRKHVERHRLRREIVATVVTNSMVNRVGPTFVSRLIEEMGRPACDVARAYIAARDVYKVRSLWGAIEGLDNRVDTAWQMEMFHHSETLIERATRWFLRQNGGRIEVSQQVSQYRSKIHDLAPRLEGLLPSRSRALMRRRRNRLQQAGVPKRLADRVAGLDFLASGCDIVLCARENEEDVERVARIYYGLGQRLGIDRVRRAAARLEQKSRWERAASSALVNDLFHAQARLTDQVVEGCAGRPSAAIETLLDKHRPVADTLDQLLEELRPHAKVDFSMLSTAERQVRRLAGGW